MSYPEAEPEVLASSIIPTSSKNESSRSKSKERSSEESGDEDRLLSGRANLPTTDGNGCIRRTEFLSGVIEIPLAEGRQASECLAKFSHGWMTGRVGERA